MGAACWCTSGHDMTRWWLFGVRVSDGLDGSPSNLDKSLGLGLWMTRMGLHDQDGSEEPKESESLRALEESSLHG